MAGRKALAGVAIAAAIATAGCKVVSDPPKSAIVQNVEFLRGCWVAKVGPNGSVTAFLRLLPDSADGLAYQGYLQAIEGGEMKSSLHVSFARDGSSMTMRPERGGPVLPMDQVGGLARPFAPLPDDVAAKLPKVAHRVTYAANPGRPDSPWMAAEGGGERLAIYAMGNGGERMGDLFRGERDGCD